MCTSARGGFRLTSPRAFFCRVKGSGTQSVEFTQKVLNSLKNEGAPKNVPERGSGEFWHKKARHRP